jgi:hypothetical protein
MKSLEEEMQMWKENSNKNFAKVLTQIDNEFRKVIIPTTDEYGIESTPVSMLKIRWTMEENADDKMIEYVGRLLTVLSDYDFISIKSNKIIVEDEPLKALITKIRKISSFKKEHLEETVRFYNL